MRWNLLRSVLIRDTSAGFRRLMEFLDGSTAIVLWCLTGYLRIFLAGADLRDSFRPNRSLVLLFL